MTHNQPSNIGIADLDPLFPNTAIQQLQKYVDDSMEIAQHELNIHVAEFQKSPFYALEWSKMTFTYAARLKCLKILDAQLKNIGNLVTPNMTIAFIKQYWLKQVLDKSKSVPSSTSQQSNICQMELLSASSEIVELLNYYEV